MKKNWAILIVTLPLLLSACKNLFEKHENYQHHSIIKSQPKKTINTSIPITNQENKETDYPYENQDGSFNNMFDQNGNYIGYYKIGKPYKVNGKTYSPREHNSYNEIGTASWYGDFFNGKRTANGEIFNSREITAAHKTLPLPSIVRVTNLENGKMIMARVNDRGPFSHNRLIDLSRESAKLLGFKEKGTAKVKVELLPNETKRLLQQLNLNTND